MGTTARGQLIFGVPLDPEYQASGEAFVDNLNKRFDHTFSVWEAVEELLEQDGMNDMLEVCSMGHYDYDAFAIYLKNNRYVADWSEYHPIDVASLAVDRVLLNRFHQWCEKYNLKEPFWFVTSSFG